MVYGHLLCPHMNGKLYFGGCEKIRHYGLEPAILQTCKQVCKEASRVLYTKNDIFVIRVDESIYQRRAETRPNFWAFEHFCAIAKVNGGKIGGVPVLTVDLSEKGKPARPRSAKARPATNTETKITRARAKRAENGEPEKPGMLPQKPVVVRKKPIVVPEKPVVFIGFLPALSKFCQLLGPGQCAGDLQLVADLKQIVGRSLEKQQGIITECLERLSEAEGLGQVTILAESEHSATAASAATLMKTCVQSVADFVSRVNAYVARASRQLKDGKWDDARDTYKNALGFFDEHDHLTYYTKDGWPRLEQRKTDIQREYISCCLKVGRTGEARGYALLILGILEQDRSPRGECYWDQVADIHCAIGRSYVIDGALNSALYSFLQALIAAPGHAEADQAIDHLEARVKSRSKPEDVIVRLNIECVLQSVRRQAPGSQRMDEDKTSRLVRCFCATYREIESLIRSREVRPNEPWCIATFESNS